jgi:hypothetical protein
VTFVVASEFVDRMNPRLDPNQLAEQAPLNLGEFAALPKFDGNFEPELPGNAWSRGWLRFNKSTKGSSPDGWGRHRMAVLEFSFPLRGRGSLDYGLLMVVPRNAVADGRNPLPKAFLPNLANYQAGQLGNFEAVTWASGEFVYVCIVQANGHSLKSLEQALNGPTA